MMLHQDASRFARLPGQVGQYDLVVTLDDATSAIYSAFLVAEEGTLSSFRGIAEGIDRHGLFCELYTDRGSHYFDTPNAGEAVSKTARTQVGRALAQLGIRHIAAYSPAAPRPFRARLSNPPGPPAQGAGLAGDRHHRSGQPLAKAVPACILRLQEERRVGNDNPVKWRGLPPQIPPTPLRAHCAPISCARWRAYTGIPTGSWRSSLVHTAWPNTDPMDTRSRLNPIAARR
jgi:hypothetical protein